MKQINYASMADVKRLLLMAAENHISVVFCDPNDAYQQEWRVQLIQHNWAKIYEDMSLVEMKIELEAVLRFHNVESNKETFDELKEYYEPLRDKSTLKEEKK